MDPSMHRTSTRYRTSLSSLFVSIFLAYSLLINYTLADQQTWPLPEEVSASLLHEIPVLHTAFVQIGEELHYLNHPIRPENVHHLPVFDSSKISERGADSQKIFQKTNFNVLKMAGKGKLPMEMDPPMMDFGQNSVGSAQKRKIYIRNMKNEPIYLDAIVVNSIEFQSSYFDQFKLEPLGVTSFDVVFLPREIGKRSTTVHIYSSVGMFTYKVQGNCISNPYRISPFTGYRLPMNSSISKPVMIFNPHPYTMRITEIETSGGNGHIELPHEVDSQLAGEPPQYWDIRPYQTKQIATVVLVGGTSENSTVFVRIASEIHVTSEHHLPNTDIYLTIPIEVLKRRGVYSTDDILDFGLIRQGVKSDAKTFSVAQYQIGGRLEFETLYVEKGDHTAIYMEFASHPPIIVYPPNKGSITLGPKADLVKVYLEGSRVQMTSQQQIKHISGHIIAISRGGNYNISIPYRADVFRGELVSIGNDLSIQEDLRPPHQRIIRVENQLPFDVAIYNISMAPELIPYFSVRLVDRTALIRSGHISPVFVLKYNKKLPLSFDNSTIFVHTNVSTFNLSLSTYTGKMNVEMTSVDKSSFDFGFVEKNDTRTIRFIVWNHNRAEMRLKNLVVPDRAAYRLYEVGVKSIGNFSDVRNDERLEYVEMTDVDIPPLRGKIFDLELKVPWDGIVRNGNIVFETDYESKVFGVSYQVSTGSLQSIPEEISFGQTFPSKLVYRTLQVFNSFNEDMTVTRLTTLNEDPRFFFEGFDPKSPPVLRSGRLTNLGRVMFSPSAPCEHEYCYLGLPLESTDGAWFTHGLGLPSNLPEIDSYLYKQLRRKYDALVKNGKHHVNTTIILDTDKAKNIKIKTSAELVWPRLLTRSSIHFPLTALGNFTIVNLTLANPTNVPVAIQVIPLVIYPDAESLVELMRPHLASDLTEHVEMNETLMFSLRDTELFTLKPDSPVPKLREAFEYHLNHEMPRYNNEINIPRFTLSMILKPHMKVRLRLGFLPSDYTLRSSLLLIRNNLTALEPVVMYGKGARIGVKVEGAEARSRKPLLFEIRHDHLTDCNNPKRLMHKLHSTLTVRRPFQVMNSGEVQFTVTNMSINGVPCENRGFRILNCYPFRLQPNETYALDIAYTPDFLTTTNEADLQLYMHMNGSAWLFPLAATVPGDMLAKCHQALPRPPFENIMYYSCVTALIFCLVCVLACAYLEGDRAIACAIRQQFATPRHVFDLNNLKAGSSNSSIQTTTFPPIASETVTKKTSTTIRPSTLRTSSDAWWIKKVFYNLANRVVTCVHLVWKWSVIWRKDKPSTDNTTKAGKTNKKKNPVTKQNIEEFRNMMELVGNKKKQNNGEMSEFNEKEEEELAEMWAQRKDSAISSASHLTTGDQTKTSEAEPTLSKSQKKKKKAAQQKENNNSEITKPEQNVQPKLETKKNPTPGPSPKPKTSNQKKKTVPVPTVKNTPVPIVPNVSIPVVKQLETPKKPVEKKTSRASSKTPKTPQKSTSEVPPATQPSLTTLAPAPPTSSTSPDLFYRQFLASMGMPMDAGMWDTPAAQAAMPFMNLWNYGGPLSVEQMEDLIRQASGGGIQTNTSNTTTSTNTPSEEAIDWRNEKYVGGDDESIGGEEAPIWVDEEVNVSDAEMDFSAMAAASRDIFQDEEDEESERRRQRSPSQASSTLSRRLESSPQKMGGRRLTIGSEKKNNQSSNPNYEFTRTPGNPNRLQNPIEPATRSNESFWGNSSDNQWGTSQISSGANQVPNSVDDDPLSLSHLGINLAENPANLPLFGNTMFSGPEFNLWSSSSLFYPPQSQQTSSQNEQTDENDENKSD
uniref:TMEM131_like domain-containing protein n=1 Tax=Caenorhabditis tropicalis TaxID=1561998 RepID=A0A1I7U365_9PELO